MAEQTNIANVIEQYQTPGGAYPASPNFKMYQYSWFRDGAFIADGMSRAGHIESAEQFFGWCAKIMTDRRQQILDGAKLDARYTYDGQEVEGEWGNFQLDGIGTWLWAMMEHAKRHERPLDAYQEGAGLAQHYLATQWQEPSIDWWEERSGLHAASLACIYAGLNAYEHPAAEAVRQAIKPDAERPDASLLVCNIFDAVDEASFAPVLEDIENELVGPDGGVHRHPDDVYYGGGEWPILTGFLGWYYAKNGRMADARAQLDWLNDHIDIHGWLPEQTPDHLLHPEAYDGWVQKWGEPANPLLWSHGMYLTLASVITEAEAAHRPTHDAAHQSDLAGQPV